MTTTQCLQLTCFLYIYFFNQIILWVYWQKLQNKVNSGLISDRNWKKKFFFCNIIHWQYSYKLYVSWGREDFGKASIIVIHIPAFCFHGFALILFWCFCLHTEIWVFVLFQTNVEGHNCDTCKPNTFGLSVKNPFGCSRCYCYGLTQACSEAQGLIRMWVSRLSSLASCCL